MEAREPQIRHPKSLERLADLCSPSRGQQVAEGRMLVGEVHARADVLQGTPLPVPCSPGQVSTRAGSATDLGFAARKHRRQNIS